MQRVWEEHRKMSSGGSMLELSLHQRTSPAGEQTIIPGHKGIQLEYGGREALPHK